MRPFVWFLVAVVICLTLSSICLADQKEDWLPISQADLQLKQVPGDPGAGAIQLYYANYVDDSTQAEFIYQRIKILNDSGKKWADVEIPILKGFVEVTDLKARTIRADGTTVDFTGKPFEKTIIKGRGVKFLARTFTLPEAGPGTIVEYKYKLRWLGYLTSDEWTVQHDLFTVRESFTFKSIPAENLALDDIVSRVETGSYRLAWVTFFLNKQPAKGKGVDFQLELENIPAFQSESYMPPEDDLKSSVRFFYLPGTIGNVDQYWEAVGKAAAGRVEQMIGNRREAADAAQQAIGGETDAEKKLRKLYARAQQIRNLSYEREQSAEEKKREKVKENSNVADTFKRGYGDREDVTFAFVAMARAAGFDASVLLVSNRESRLFHKEVLSRRQLDSQIVVVKLNGKDIYLDPGTRFCPYGTLRWVRTSTAAMKLDRKSGVLINVPAAQYTEAVTQRLASLELTPDGTLQGEINVEFQGQEALEHRLDALDSDEAGRKRDLENELKVWLQQGANVRVLDVRGWEETDSPLVVRYRLQIPGYASVVGKRMLATAYIFQETRKEAFAHAERKYPLYFSYAFSEKDRVQIKLPEGFTLEGVPEQQEAKISYAGYRRTSQAQGLQVTTERQLLFNAIYLPGGAYPEVKDFFSKVYSGDEQQIVLRAGGLGK
jgi:hypothetical protein